MFCVLHRTHAPWVGGWVWGVRRGTRKRGLSAADQIMRRGTNQWGVPEDIFVRLIASYHEQGVPIAAFEVDCNFEYEVWWPSYGGWCWKDWSQWNTTAFPSGGEYGARDAKAPVLRL